MLRHTHYIVHVVGGGAGAGGGGSFGNDPPKERGIFGTIRPWCCGCIVQSRD